MYVTMKMAIAMMKRKKIQNALISIILILMSTLLYIGLSIVNQSSPFETMFTRANATDSLYILSSEGNDISKSQSFWDSQNGVKDTLSYDTHMSTIEYMLNGKLETETAFISEYQTEKDLDLLYINDRELAQAPKGNEMLINYNFAKGRNLKIGDTITFTNEGTNYAFVINDFVVDPQFGNSFVSPDRCFVASDFFEKNQIQYNTVILGVKYNTYNEDMENVLHEDYLKTIEGETPPLYIRHSSIVMSYGVITGIISSVLIVVALFILLIVIFVIRSTIRNMILQRYKSIGVKKVIGYTNKQIRESFLWSFVLLGFVSSIIGVFIGIPIRNSINEGISYDIQVGMDYGIDIFTLITVVIVLVLTTFFTFISIKQASKIKPVQAIKYGMPESNLSINKFRINHYKKLPLSLLLAIKQMLMNKKKSLTTIFTMILLIYIALLINNMGNTLGTSSHFAKYLLGARIGDYTINSTSSEPAGEVIQKVESIDTIESVIFITMRLNESTKGLSSKKVPIGGLVYYGNVPDDVLILTDGRQPKNNQEVVITNKLADEIGKTIGDYMLIETKDSQQQYLICGTFNSVSFDSLGYIRVETSIPETLLGENGFYWVYSNEKHVIIEEVELQVKSVLSDSASVSKYDSNVKNILSTLEPFPTMILILLTVFLIISGVVIVNWTMMDISNMTRVFGILKATGFSNGNITKILIIKSVLLASIGILVGFILNLLTMNPIMLGVFKITPFSTIELPVLFDFWGCILLMGLFLLISILATLLPSQKINSISPKKLIAE